jgi:hypothetical protein
MPACAIALRNQNSAQAVFSRRSRSCRAGYPRPISQPTAVINSVVLSSVSSSRAGHGVAGVVIEQPEHDLVERGLEGGELRAHPRPRLARPAVPLHDPAKLSEQHDGLPDHAQLHVQARGGLNGTV